MKLYRIFIPKTYNDKSKIPLKLIQNIVERFGDRFGGYTLDSAYLPAIEGFWKDNNNLKYKEEHFLLELFTEDTFDNKKWIIAQKECIRQELKQEEIFIMEMYAEIL